MYRNILKSLFPYLLLSVLYAALHLLAFSTLMSGALPLVVDAVLYAALIVASGVVLRSLLFYGKQENLPLMQRVGNLLLLGVLLAALISLLSYAATSLLFGEETGRLYLKLLPVKALLVFLFYIIILQYLKGEAGKGQEEKEAKEEEVLAVPEEAVPDDEPAERLERITVKTGTKIDVLPIGDILYLESFGDYVYLYTREGRYIKEQTMKYFEENLPADLFARVHRSYIVCIEGISRIELYEKQSRQLILKNGDRVKVSPSGYRMLKARLGI